LPLPNAALTHNPSTSNTFASIELAELKQCG
jgi:hypothetical protein